MSGSFDTVVVWFRRDVRVYDNPALVAAVNCARTVIPVYIWAAEEEGQFQPGRQTRWWAKHSVTCLAKRLEELGSRLIIHRARDSLEALKRVVTESGAQAVFFNHLYDSISMVRDQQIKDALRPMGVAVSTFNADLLYEPWEVLDEQQQPYTTFKAFWDRCLAMPYAPPLPLPEPAALPPVPEQISSRELSQVDWFMTAEQEASTQALAHRWDPSPQAGMARLDRFLKEGLPTFEHDRAKTDRDSTTMLSPWIHMGTMSVRHVYYRVAQRHAEWQAEGQDKGRSCLDFLQQVGYREYSRYLSFHFPFITERSMLAHLRAVPWRLDQAAYKAWRQGLTGYPLVDAGMRQLWSMGWCHNRVRVVASHFLVKHLLLPWQWGLKHLWDCQIDADLECDALGWQYVSGCLADAHPFHYLLDLEKEWQRFDPDGNYVRRWLPVLAQLPSQYIHQPWAAPPEVLEEAGVELGFNYPWPIITMDAARDGVEFAASVVERCAAPGSSGSNKSTGGVTSGLAGILPRKEPYRAPTDPALISSFLTAARDGASFEYQLPPLFLPGGISGSGGGEYSGGGWSGGGGMPGYNSGSAFDRYMAGGRGALRHLQPKLAAPSVPAASALSGESSSPGGKRHHHHHHGLPRPAGSSSGDTPSAGATGSAAELELSGALGSFSYTAPEEGASDMLTGRDSDYDQDEVDSMTEAVPCTSMSTRCSAFVKRPGPGRRHALQQVEELMDSGQSN